MAVVLLLPALAYGVDLPMVLRPFFSDIRQAGSQFNHSPRLNGDIRKVVRAKVFGSSQKDNFKLAVKIGHARATAGDSQELKILMVSAKKQRGAACETSQRSLKYFQSYGSVGVFKRRDASLRIKRSIAARCTIAAMWIAKRTGASALRALALLAQRIYFWRLARTINLNSP